MYIISDFSWYICPPNRAREGMEELLYVPILATATLSISLNNYTFSKSPFVASPPIHWYCTGAPSTNGNPEVQTSWFLESGIVCYFRLLTRILGMAFLGELWIEKNEMGHKIRDVARLRNSSPVSSTSRITIAEYLFFCSQIQQVHRSDQSYVRKPLFGHPAVDPKLF